MFSQSELKHRIALSLQIIEKYSWLLDSYVLDFFVDDHWNKLPSSWRETFQYIDLPELGDLLLGGTPKRVYPLSFLALLYNIRVLTLSRKPENFEVQKKTYKTKDDFDSEKFDETSESKNKKFDNLFLKHIKLKKRHEISLISKLIFKISKEAHCRAVVDIGSGVGHLVRNLSYKHRLKTVGIEAQDKLVDAAKTIDDQFCVTISKYTDKTDFLKELKPQYINIFLSPEVKESILVQLYELINSNFGLIGLHPCGDLGPFLMKMFIEAEKIKFIAIVSCCHMKLTCNDSNELGYPMSVFVNKIKNNHLSYESRELACHALEMYCERLKKGLYEDLQIHCFRALLEKFLVSKWPRLKHSGLKSVKHYDTLSFERYCNIATERLNVQLNIDDVEDDINKHLNRWKEVVIFYTLRLCLAPLVESVILMDRMLFLHENGCTCEIIPLFDPVISPRNHILIAKKN